MEFLKSLDKKRSGGRRQPAFAMHDGDMAIVNAIEEVYGDQPPLDLMCWVHFLRAVKRNAQKISSAPFMGVDDADKAHKARCEEVIGDLKLLHYISSIDKFNVAKRLFLEKWREEVSIIITFFYC